MVKERRIQKMGDHYESNQQKTNITNLLIIFGDSVIMNAPVTSTV